MNANRLLAHYERIADAPDAIARLRRFILDLAVRGKLVPQDPNDDPASELLKRIAKDKAHLVKARKISKQVSFQPRDLSEAPFDLPGSWDWCPSTYPSYIVSDRGKQIQTKDVVETGNFPVVDQGKMLIRGYHNDASKVIRVKEPIVLFGDHTRETKLIDFDFVVGADGVKLLHPVSLHTAYYFLALQWLPLESRGYGRHFKLLKASFIPLAPLAEQHRIAAKVDELMGLCDRLEAARTEREATRDRLAAASLIRLNDLDPDPVVFRNHAAFALENLTPLTTRRDQIKALRQTILNLAVRGKLVPQDPNDEPASELLKRRKIAVSNVWPFELPASWAWVNVGAVAVARLGKMLDKAKNKGTPRRYLRNINVRWFDFDLSDLLEMRFEDSELPEFALQFGDVLICEGGEPGRAAVWDGREDDIYFQKAIHRIRFLNIVDSSFFVKALRASADDGRLAEYFTGTGIKHFTGKSLAAYFFPLPPLPEQHRIVTRVDELVALCDRLEANLSTEDDTRRCMCDALLHETLGEALEPVS